MSTITWADVCAVLLVLVIVLLVVWSSIDYEQVNLRHGGHEVKP